MDYLSCHLLLQHLVVFFYLVEAFFVGTYHFEYIVFDLIEAPEGKDDEMASLGVLRAYSIDQLIMLVINFELLKFLFEAATVKDCCLHDSADKFIVEEHSNLWPVRGTQTYIKVPEGKVGNMLVIILAHHLPRPVRGWYQYPLQHSYFFFECQIYIPFEGIVLIGGIEFVLIGKIAGHEG